jgi:hypothetical protein
MSRAVKQPVGALQRTVGRRPPAAGAGVPLRRLLHLLSRSLLLPGLDSAWLWMQGHDWKTYDSSYGVVLRA